MKEEIPAHVSTATHGLMFAATETEHYVAKREA